MSAWSEEPKCLDCGQARDDIRCHLEALGQAPWHARHYFRPANATVTLDSATLCATLKKKADYAYCDGVALSMRHEFLNWEAKAKARKFGAKELKAHTAAAEQCGRHRAFQEVLALLRAAETRK